jgi:polyribonucleotide nucleotidyltransferase
MIAPTVEWTATIGRSIRRAKINIEDDGAVKIARAKSQSIRAAQKWIKSFVAEPELGEIYERKSVNAINFGRVRELLWK